MSRATALLAGYLLAASAALGDSLIQSPKIEVRPGGRQKLYTFPLKDVRLPWGGCPFHQGRARAGKYLTLLESDTLLYNFRFTAGLAPTPRYMPGGWEDPRCEFRGHFTGHYLSAAAMSIATGFWRQPIQLNADRIVAGLAECQVKLGSGYLGAFPEESFDRLESGRPNGAPYYTLHKIMAGALDMYVYADNPQGLEICKRLADWVIARNARFSDEQMQKILETDHGGMSEVLANLYGVTGEEKYLKMAQRFNHWAVLGPAARGEDRLTGRRPATETPKFVGAARQYELTGDERLRAAAEFFWRTVVQERSYVVGGTGDGERFPPKENLSRFGPCTCETCATYNLLKLTRHLFCWDPRVEYADYYERALYNHILASYDCDTPDTIGRYCYHLSLRPGSQKIYNGLLDSFWCCLGTGLESHAKHGDSILFHDGEKAVYVNLFVFSSLNWKAKGISIGQETAFPDPGAVIGTGEPGAIFSRLRVHCRSPMELTIQVRHPSWAKEGFRLKLNGSPLPASSKPGSYAVIGRTWKTGDVLDIMLPFALHVEAFPDNPRRFAILHGPLVLAAVVDPAKPLPQIVADRTKLLAALKPVEGKPSTFTAPADVIRPAVGGSSVILEPFLRLRGHQPYMLHWTSAP